MRSEVATGEIAEPVAAVSTGRPDRPVALRSVDRALADRYSTYLDEVERLVSAGLAVIRRTGKTNPKVGDIVAEAGLSNQAFYRHFRSKDELLLAILDDGMRQLVSYLRHQMEKEASPQGKARRWVEGIMRQAVNPEAAEATRGVGLNTNALMRTFPNELTHMEAMIEAPLADAVRGAASGAADSELEADVRSAYRLVMGSMHACLAVTRPPTDSEIEQLTGFVLRGVGLQAKGGT